MALTAGAKRIRSRGKSVRRRPRGRALTRKQRSQVKSVVNSAFKQRTETKYHNQLNVGSSPSYTGAISLMNDIAVGTDDQTRVGDELYMKSISLNYNVTVSSTDSTNVVRAIVFQWFDDSTASLSSILQQTGDLSAVVSPYHHDNMYGKKFKILYDKVHLVNDASNPQSYGSISITKIKRRKVHYTAGSSTPDNNRVYLAFISDSAAASHPSVNYYLRIRYTDM